MTDTGKNNLTLTRADVTDALVREIGCTRQESAELLDRTLELIGEALETGGTVKLSRFGNFVVREKSAREGRNPKTKTKAEISARRVVTFRPSPMLKGMVDT
ncbi:MAG: integration host factor subunit alpha [Pseudomonadota bacterium]